MFTGLIEELCRVESLKKAGRTLKIKLDIKELADEAKLGDSIAVNGVCLTVVELNGQSAVFDVSEETVQRSTIAELKTGDMVNAEPAMKASGRFGGHFVQGHVDGMGIVKSVNVQNDYAEIFISADKKLIGQMVEKGSVAVDGISLTIAELKEDSFKLAVIPETWQRTNLPAKRVGDKVNIETDLIVKVVQRQLENILPGESRGLTAERLKELGF